MSDDDEAEEYYGPTEALVYLTFEDDDGNEIVEFSGLNIPAPDEGEEVTLSSVELDGDVDGEVDKENLLHDSDMYEVVSVHTRYVSIPDELHANDDKESLFNSPMIYKTAIVEQLDEEEEQKDE